MRAVAYVGLVLTPLLLGCPSDPDQMMEPEPEPPPPAECGNGRLEMGEECEGQPPPDGCDPSSCTVLEGFTCEPEPPPMIPSYEDTEGPVADGTAGDTDAPLPGLEWASTCMLLDLCEDGVIDMITGEECDDGNSTDGDGCTDCRVDIDYTCMGEPSVCRTCGDGWFDENLGEECETGEMVTMPGPGCADDCTVIEGWECEFDETMARSICRTICGDGIWLASSVEGVTIGTAEGCDDGNLEPGDGCDAECEIEPGCDCSGPPPATANCICGLGSSTGTDSGTSSGTDTDTDTDTDTATDSATAGSTTAATTG